MDDECEVCLTPTVDIITFTIEAAPHSVHVHACRDCATAVFKAMAERYNAAVDENNRNVDALLRWLDIERNT